MDTKILFGALLVAGVLGGFAINGYFMDNESLDDNITDVEVGNEAPNFKITDTRKVIPLTCQILKMKKLLYLEVL